ncbi:glycerol-3-phosphate cytidylyltransferase [Acholeplasma granularum]|uniref:glycerol-3-phosphate cytidylyltransferase n=1 Tax=Acholeplasma granularum TaxID=264635 RepID=UPI0004709BC3|nr:glycerol-3-phosphate cytidylyltransferase [Acholeplasma granularum]
MKKVLTYGTFDLLHVGHINLLRRASELGDYLVVGISTDEFNIKKGKKSIYTFNERKTILESIKYVNEIIAETTWEQKVNDVKKHSIDIFVIGDDWTGKFDFLKEYCEVIYLARTPDISTTETKENIKKP